MAGLVPGLRLEPDEVTDLGEGRLLVGLRAVGRGSESGVLTEQRGFTLYTVRRGRVARHEFFFDRDQAEKAAGLGGGDRSSADKRTTARVCGGQRL